MTEEQLPFVPAQLSLDGFFLLRATLQPTTANNRRYWSTDLVHDTDDEGELRRFYLFADLNAVQDGWMLGSTVGGRIRLPESVALDTLPIVAFEAECRRLFEETLWDAAAMHVRQLGAMGRVENLAIPPSAPRDHPDWTDRSRAVVPTKTA